ncbi:hypothetical protein Gpo141_00007097 [Globisporangium polare]
MYVCACDMLSWNAHCIGIVSLWLWMHAVVVSDAITPIMRKKIGLHLKLLALPVVSFVLVQAVIMYDLVADGGLGLKDRKLFHVVVDNRQIEFRVVPFFVSRLGTTFAWSFRLLWRIFRVKDDELVFLRGKVAYGYAAPPHAVIPVALSEKASHGKKWLEQLRPGWRYLSSFQ